MEISIGELSRRTGVKVPTIRYYKSVALMPAPPRSEGKQRRYSEPEVSRLIFIRHARELGFEIDAIRTLLALQDNPNQPCRQPTASPGRALPKSSSGFAALRLSKPSWS